MSAASVRSRAPAVGPRGSPWLLRVLVLAAFAATLWFAGPRAWRVASAHLRSDASLGVAVPLDRVGNFVGPEWLDAALIRALLEDLEPRMRGEVRLMDDAAAREAQQRIAMSPFVLEARLERRFPDRFRVELDLRRPEAQLLLGDRAIALLDADGVALPPGSVAVTLPQIVADDYEGGVQVERLVFGEPFPDPRICAAAAVAHEWRTNIAAAIGDDAPRLAAVDARNFRWRWIRDLGASQVLVALERADGGVAWFHYGRAAHDDGSVPVDIRVEILRNILAARPGLAGLRAGDLRLQFQWRDALR